MCRYIEYAGPASEFEANLERVTYRDLRPVEITLRDLPAQPQALPRLLVSLRNAYPYPIDGTVRVEAEGLQLSPSSQDVHLGAVEEQQFGFTVTGASVIGNGPFATKVTVQTNRGMANACGTGACGDDRPRLTQY